MVRACLAVVTSLFLLGSLAEADTWVRGYTRKDGRYVAPHMRSAPDGFGFNNHNYPGNLNPNTGKVTPFRPSYPYEGGVAPIKPLFPSQPFGAERGNLEELRKKGGLAPF